MTAPVPAPPRRRPVPLDQVASYLRPITEDEAVLWLVGETLMAASDAERINVARQSREAGLDRLEVVCLRCREAGVSLHRVRPLIEHLAGSPHQLRDLRLAEPARVVR